MVKVMRSLRSSRTLGARRGWAAFSRGRAVEGGEEIRTRWECTIANICILAGLALILHES